MFFKQFKKSLLRSGICESIRSYGHLIEMTNDGALLIDGQLTEHKSLEEAKRHIKNKIYSEKLEQEIYEDTYEEISENKIANIIKEHHNVRVTDTLIESYIELASSNIFTLDPVVTEIRKLNKLDVVVEGKIHYGLNDGSTVAIDNATQELLNNLLIQHHDVVEHMRECKENFIYVVEKIKE